MGGDDYLDMKTLASVLVRKLAQTNRPKRHIMVMTLNWRSSVLELALLVSIKVSTFIEKRITRTVITSHAM